MKVNFAVGLSSLLLAVTTAHADYQAGLDAYDAGDHATALAEWLEEINRPGDPENSALYRESLYAIAMLYWQGQGVDQNYAVAAAWLRQAAHRNHPGAQNKLGFLFSMGEGVGQDYQEARRWFERAAALGDPDAAYNLDQMFRQGLLQPAEEEPAASAPQVADKAPAATPIEAAPARLAQPAGDAGVPWILAQNPEHYTIQVIALRDPEKLYEFIDRNPGWAPFAVYRPSGNRRPLWVLVQGAYPSVAAARGATRSFPGGLQKRGELWIRKFGMVQGMIE